MEQVYQLIELAENIVDNQCNSASGGRENSREKFIEQQNYRQQRITHGGNFTIPPMDDDTKNAVKICLRMFLYVKHCNICL